VRPRRGELGLARGVAHWVVGVVRGGVGGDGGGGGARRGRHGGPPQHNDGVRARAPHMPSYHYYFHESPETEAAGSALRSLLLLLLYCSLPVYPLPL